MRCCKCGTNAVMLFPGDLCSECNTPEVVKESLPTQPKRNPKPKKELTLKQRLMKHRKSFEKRFSKELCLEIRRLNKEDDLNCEEIAQKVGVPYHAVYTYVRGFQDAVMKPSGGSKRTTSGRFRNHLILKDEVQRRLLEGMVIMEIVKECGLKNRAKVDEIRCAMVKAGKIAPAKRGRKFKGEYENVSG